MPEPTSTVAAVAVTAGGLTLFGVVTGLHPALLLAGLAGGWWALSYQRESMPLPRRVSVLAISSLMAAWITPPAVSATIATGVLGQTMTGELIQFPGAALVGLVVHRIVGPALMRFAEKKAGEVAP